MSDALVEIIGTLKELKRMHQLNFELLEQLNVICKWILDNHIPIPNEEHMTSLLHRSLTLLTEIQADTPKILQYQKLTDEKKHPLKTDEDETVPLNLDFNFVVGLNCFLWKGKRKSGKINSGSLISFGFRELLVIDLCLFLCFRLDNRLPTQKT